MPQKKTSKYSKNSKNSSSRDDDVIQIRETGQQYAIVIKNLGGCHLEVLCYDGITRMAHIRGKMRKRQWITVGDVLLIGQRDYQDSKCDVLLKYKHEQIIKLKEWGEIPQTSQQEGDEQECAFEFNDI